MSVRRRVGGGEERGGGSGGGGRVRRIRGEVSCEKGDWVEGIRREEGVGEEVFIIVFSV